MLALRPAPPTDEGAKLWNRVKAQATVDEGTGGGGDLFSDPFRDALLAHATGQLAAQLAEEPGLKALAEEIKADDEELLWQGAEHQAKVLGLTDRTSIVVLSLLSAKTTSDEHVSPYFHALQAATAALYDTAPPQMGPRGRTLFAEHREFLSGLVVAQRVLTAQLLACLGEVSLHRGDAIDASQAGSPRDPMLWPLASFATDFETATEFAQRAKNRKLGVAVVYSAVVPAGRILATPATGLAAAREREVIVATSYSGDRATVTVVSCLL